MKSQRWNHLFMVIGFVTQPTLVLTISRLRLPRGNRLEWLTKVRSLRFTLEIARLDGRNKLGRPWIWVQDLADWIWTFFANKSPPWITQKRALKISIRSFWIRSTIILMISITILAWQPTVYINKCFYGMMLYDQVFEWFGTSEIRVMIRI